MKKVRSKGQLRFLFWEQRIQSGKVGNRPIRKCPTFECGLNYYCCRIVLLLNLLLCDNCDFSREKLMSDINIFEFFYWLVVILFRLFLIETSYINMKESIRLCILVINKFLLLYFLYVFM